MMEVEFEVPVAAPGRPEKYKNERLVLATVPVGVDIEEASSAELKPAVSLLLNINSPSRLDFRSHDGRLYLPLMPAASLLRTIPLFELPAVPFHFQHTATYVEKQLVDDGAWDGRSTVFPHAHKETMRRRLDVRPTPLSRMSFETLDLPSINDQIAMFERRVSRLLCVDGMLHVQVAEPIISVTRSVNNSSIFLVRPEHRPFFGIRRDKSFPDGAFRIDESDEARDFCLALGAQNEPLLNFHKFNVEVHDPAALHLNSNRASAYASAHNLVMGIGHGSAIDNHPCASDLRTLSLLVGRHNEVDCPDELCDLLSFMVDTEKAGVSIFSLPARLDTAEIIASRWDNREISFPSCAFTHKDAYYEKLLNRKIVG
jgi:hypothetical protein